MNTPSANSLRRVPAVTELLDHPDVRTAITNCGRDLVLAWVRGELEELRKQLQAGSDDLPADRAVTADVVAERIGRRVQQYYRTRLGRVINATGVILHTGLGRAPLSVAATAALAELAGAGNVEIDLETGERRHRGHQLEAVWRTLTGAEDSLVVNNNAAATLLTLQTLCGGREVVISRGQLIEIGGSFRLPEIFELSGAVLREVGTTNRTRLADYERAIGPDTAAIMHVHPSNYRVIGFATTPPIEELAPLARARGLVAIDDIGSGAVVDVTRFGLPLEPTFAASLAAGADVVLGSGDKLLGGPQCGVILGKAEIVSRLRRHPLARAVRVGKLTLAALTATLDAYLRDTVVEEIPTIAMLAASPESLLTRAKAIAESVGEVESLSIVVETDTAPVGGGSLPGAELPTAVLALSHAGISADELARRLRLGSIRLFTRIRSNEVLVDLRSVWSEDDSRVALALRLAARSDSSA